LCATWFNDASGAGGGVDSGRFCRLLANAVGLYALNRDDTHASRHPAYHLRRVECHAKIDVFVIDEDDILLLVQEDKRHTGFGAATYSGGHRRFSGQPHQTNACPAIDAKVMPVIVLVGSLPTFYKIPVTKKLAQAVALRRFLPQYASSCGALPRSPSERGYETA
jgi:hypothetical protein